MGCEVNKSAKAIAEDKFKLQVESQHFKYYSFNKDVKCLNDLEKSLEDNYKRISNDLNVSLKDKVEIEIYSDIQSFHNAIGAPNAPMWDVGTGWGNKIKMVSQLNPGEYHTYDTLMQVVVHEFTHVMVSNINQNLKGIPLWLNEGTAAYEAKQMNSNMKGALKGKILKNDIPTLYAMNSNNLSDGGYAFSYTAVEYIVKNYGYNSLIGLIKSPSNLREILGTTSEGFEKSWRTYLIKNYK
jgi:hypothetical protein